MKTQDRARRRWPVEIWPASTASAPSSAPDGALLLDLQRRRQGAGAQQQGQVVGVSVVKLPVIWPEPPVIGSLDRGAEITLLSSTMAKRLPMFWLVAVAEAPRAQAVEAEGDHRLAGLLVEAEAGRRSASRR